MILLCYDIVMKRHLRPRFERAGGPTPWSCHRSPASLVIQNKERWNYDTAEYA